MVWCVADGALRSVICYSRHIICWRIRECVWHVCRRPTFPTNDKKLFIKIKILFLLNCRFSHQISNCEMPRHRSRCKYIPMLIFRFHGKSRESFSAGMLQFWKVCLPILEKIGIDINRSCEISEFGVDSESFWKSFQPELKDSKKWISWDRVKKRQRNGKTFYHPKKLYTKYKENQT